ncbi:MAG: alpha-hydroxy-acid oxidizing protein, partial [Microbacteriaceae bacterium]|nr:alpha-hydroxy-acid oxidizing protein [Microbacteriaceae bacterium]
TGHGVPEDHAQIVAHNLVEADLRGVESHGVNLVSLYCTRLDTGIMNGADVVASMALGARFTLVGRAYLYGLMAGGRAGVDRAIQILGDQVVRTMKLLEVSSVAELEPRHVTQLQRLVPRALPEVPVRAARSTPARKPAPRKVPAGTP